MIMLSPKEIEEIKKGVVKYQTIMSMYKRSNVLEDRDFQRLYNGFYVMGWRSKDWYSYYYKMLEGLKEHSSSFEDILKALKERSGKLEASFASKMYATRNPDYPIIDKWVLKYMHLSLPSANQQNRLEKTVQVYSDLIASFKELLRSKEGKEHIKLFDEIYPNSGISDTKKVDFILWQLGRRNELFQRNPEAEI